MTIHFPFENSYARLPDRFYARVAPTPVRSPRLVRLNTELALELGLDPCWLAGPEGLEVLAGRSVPETAEPIAMAYAGHQFGHFVPQLGDGRAILLGEAVDRGGVRRDIQLKGSGRTPYSRGGGAGIARIHRERSHACARHSLHARACRGRHRRAGFPGGSAAGSGVDA